VILDYREERRQRIEETQSLPAAFAEFERDVRGLLPEMERFMADVRR
jgi:hypothetical protein